MEFGSNLPYLRKETTHQPYRLAWGVLCLSGPSQAPGQALFSTEYIVVFACISFKLSSLCRCCNIFRSEVCSSNVILQFTSLVSWVSQVGAQTVLPKAKKFEHLNQGLARNKLCMWFHYSEALRFLMSSTLLP